ncbi:MAG: ferredoxin [Candidatus Kerfeldbacteria bacterium CG08_land_8_20_14_0_20_43_14]|uniref:Ferredoxin n=1 Tax=Candidatus Kerfeldbacteria bacterium CG08_land_8_20_14_0_20_43_14 TaxID=2014246 RepID=A0A2H0YQL7_9BACT|nr:MAG: ferredoxin [Candidatus Kerfeldbacteria bacterium CG08_land_8_20_14_0_20_43_14]
MSIKISVDREKCISAATCIAIAPETFELDGEGKAVIKNPTGNDEATIIEAAKSCPTQAIIITDENGKQLVP